MTSSCWDPQQYRRFSDQRRRPAQDLIARIPLAEVRTIVDLGCGDGPVTALLAQRWPAAETIGVDSSPAMLEKARQVCATAKFIDADIARWCPHVPVDLIFSNASLHWLDNHERLIPDLFRHVSPGGALAVQMPANFEAPSHQRLATLARAPSGATVSVDLFARSPLRRCRSTWSGCERRAKQSMPGKRPKC